jgi:menaquinone-dependent protoporphyrinogen IX oxidase
MNILIVYTTNAGSTAEVAEMIAEEIGQAGDQVDVRRIEEVNSVAGYDAVIVGAPMILGWHRKARKFIRQHRQALSKIKTAYFCMAMMLTATSSPAPSPAPTCIDPGLAKPPKTPDHLSIKERYSLTENYLRPILRTAPEVHPVSVAFFGGKLEMFRLKLLQMLFVMLIIRAQPGDLRDESFIRQWAEDTRSLLSGNP